MSCPAQNPILRSHLRQIAAAVRFKWSSGFFDGLGQTGKSTTPAMDHQSAKGQGDYREQANSE